MQAKLSIVPIDQLSLFIGKKVILSKLNRLGCPNVMHKMQRTERDHSGFLKTHLHEAEHHAAVNKDGSTTTK